MLQYEDYDIGIFTLNTGKDATNFIRSQFGYKDKQRRAVKEYENFNVRLVLTMPKLESFEAFWELINFGNDKFLTDQIINSDLTSGKIVRFTSGYNISQIGADQFIVTVPLELIQTGA